MEYNWEEVVLNEHVIYKLSGPFEKLFQVESPWAQIWEKNITSIHTFLQFKKNVFFFKHLNIVIPC